MTGTVKAHVKPLVWEKLYPDQTIFPRTYVGSGTLGCMYQVEHSHPDGDFYCLGSGYETLEAAKAAAQADYERSILSALTASASEPEPVAHVRTADLAYLGRNKGIQTHLYSEGGAHLTAIYANPVPTPDGAVEAAKWRENVEVLLANDPDVIRCREGGGPEDLIASLVLTVARTRRSRDEAMSRQINERGK